MIKFLIPLLIFFSLPSLAEPSLGAMSTIKVNSSGRLIPPHRYYYEEGLKYYMNDEKLSAIRRFKVAAEFGNKKADKFVSLMLLEGDGIEKDIVAGVAWLRLSANNGDRESIQLLKNYNNMLPKETLASVEEQYQKLDESYGEAAVLNNRFKFKRRFNHQTLGKPGKMEFPHQKVTLNSLQIMRLEEQIQDYYIDFQENIGEVTLGDIIIEK